ncbi:MAG: hypothetical protein ABR562_04390 [Thermoplasmatota archaeon]
MARMSLASGLCPICGRSVARTMTAHHGLLTEAYHCPMHGRREANPSGMSVAEWAAAPMMPALGEILGMPIAC